jgi:hypothetical protein
MKSTNMETMPQKLKGSKGGIAFLELLRIHEEIEKHEPPSCVSRFEVFEGFTR